MNNSDSFNRELFMIIGEMARLTGIFPGYVLFHPIAHCYTVGPDVKHVEVLVQPPSKTN